MIHLNHAFFQKSPVHSALGELVQAGHAMAKAKPGDSGIHKGRLIGKLHQLGAQIDKHHAGNQDAVKNLLAEATHRNMHLR